jgi:hypothetical protein
MVHCHSLLQRWKGLEVFRLRIEFPVLDWLAIICDYGVTRINPTLLVNEAHFSFILFVRCIHGLHKTKNIHLPVSIGGSCCAYGNDFTQWFIIRIVIKKIVVQTVAITFISKLFLKLAASGLRQVFNIQYKKNDTTGNMINK